jgi:hypothetical protein
MIAAAAPRKVWIFRRTAAQELDCISDYSKVMPTRIAKSKLMIL